MAEKALKMEIYIPLWFDYHAADDQTSARKCHLHSTLVWLSPNPGTDFNLISFIYIPLWFDYHAVIYQILQQFSVFTFHSGLIITLSHFFTS